MRACDSAMLLFWDLYFLEVCVLQIFVHIQSCFKASSKLTGLQMRRGIIDRDGESLIQKYGENMCERWSFISFGMPIQNKGTVGKKRYMSMQNY